MAKENLEMEPLVALAERIVQYANEADDKTIRAALLIREVRGRVNRGEAGDTTWSKWAAENIELSPSRLRELQRIADAEDPRKELKRIREMIRERVEKHRQKKKREQAVALQSGGDKTVKASTERKSDRQDLTGTGSDPGDRHLEKPEDAASLRNDGDGAGAAATEESNHRALLIRWAEDAPLENVEKTWAFVLDLDPAVATPDSEQVEESAAA